MGDHYLPQHYLKGFAASDRFWVHDLELGKSRLGQPKSEANVNGLWPGELEQHLAEKIEWPAQKIIDRIRQHQPMQASEKEVLATYLLTMWKRVPAARERTIAHIPGLAAEHKTGYHGYIDKMAARGELTDEEVLRGKALIADLLNDVVNTQSEHYWHHTIREGATPRTLGALRSMEWTFLVSTSHRFLTSDDPLFFFKDIGVGRNASELSIPLSTTITLLAHRQGEQRKQFRDARPNTVVQLNRRTAYNARRFIYSEVPAPWALKLGAHKPRPSRIKVDVA